jgi:hypothetical protein
VWQDNLEHGLLLEVFGLIEDELTAPDPKPSGDERPGSGIHLADHP